MACMAHRAHPDPSFNYVTCGSLITLHNPSRDVYLHSTDVKYGTKNGQSGQRSVTGTTSVDDQDSYWKVVGPRGEKCDRGTVVRCDDVIRLQHSSSLGWLRSEVYVSPLTHNQEVAVSNPQPEGTGHGRTGDERSGNERAGERTDTVDTWEVGCGTRYWGRGDEVVLRHVTS